MVVIAIVSPSRTFVFSLYLSITGAQMIVISIFASPKIFLIYLEFPAWWFTASGLFGPASVIIVTSIWFTISNSVKVIGSIIFWAIALMIVILTLTAMSNSTKFFVSTSAPRIIFVYWSMTSAASRRVIDPIITPLS